MAASELRRRPNGNAADDPNPVPAPSLGGADKAERLSIEHPSGKAKHYQIVAFFRALSFTMYFMCGCLA